MRPAHPVTFIVPSPFLNQQGYPRKPTVAEQRDLQEMYGARIIIDGFDYAAKPRKIPGLVVHLVENAEGLRDYSGDQNFFDGRGRLYRKLLDNKWAEYELLQTIDPTVMPQSILATTLLQRSQCLSELQQQSRLLVSDFIASKTKNFTDGEKKQIRIFIKTFLNASQKFFKQGAFIKYIREFGTREVDGLTHTPEADPAVMTESFCSELERLKTKLNPRARKWLCPSLRSAIQDSRRASLHIVSFLLEDPSEIMVQEKLDIAVTRDGTLAEARIDFGSSGVLLGNLRWGYDVDVEYKMRASEYFQKLWEKFPPAAKKLFGGADIVFLKNGSMKIIEFNFGCESGFLDAAQLIVPGNVFASKILGHPTPLIERLEALIKMPARAQVRELSKLIPRTKKDSETHYSLRDLHLPDVFLYIRDRMIEEWLKAPHRGEAKRLSQRFRYLARSQQKRIEDPAVRKLILDMARFGSEALLEFLNKQRHNKTPKRQESSWYDSSSPSASRL